MDELYVRYTVKDLRHFPNYYFDGTNDQDACAMAQRDKVPSGVFGLVWIKGEYVYLQKDPIGEIPLYFFIHARAVAIANTIEELRTQAGYAFDHVRTVPTRQRVRISLRNGEFRYYSCYQYLDDAHSVADVSVVAKEIRRRFIRAVVSRLPRKRVSIALLLSGGTDSSSVGCIVRRYHKNVIAYTLTVDGRGEDVVQAQRTAAFLGIPFRRVDVSSIEAVRAVGKVIQLVELYKDYDVYMAVGAYFLAKALSRDRMSAVFTGEGANELFGDYQSWGSFRVAGSILHTKRMRKLMVWGRHYRDSYYNQQLGSGLGRSLSRLNKIFFHYGLQVHNPFLDFTVVGYLLSLPKIFLDKHTKQEIMRQVLPEVPSELFPEKIRLQDGAGLTRALRKAHVTNEYLKKVFNGYFIR